MLDLLGIDPSRVRDVRRPITGESLANVRAPATAYPRIRIVLGHEQT